MEVKGFGHWGKVTQMKNHLAQTHKDFKPCLKVPDDIILPKFWKNLKNK